MWVRMRLSSGLVGVRGEEKGRDAKNMFFGGVYTLYSIRLLFQAHSPGGATVLLCLIDYVSRSTTGWGIEDEVFVWVG